MVRAIALLVAIALTVTVPSVVQARSYPCWIIRMYVSNHTRAEVEAAARENNITASERAAARACLRKK